MTSLTPVRCLYFMMSLHISHVIVEWHGVKAGPGPQDPGPRDPRPPSKFKSGSQEPGPRDPRPPQNLKVGPRNPLKFKSGTRGPPSKFKSGSLIIIFLHCLTYFVLDKYVYNMDIVFHE